ncbi:MAG: hypothetical protein KOO62_02575 [candidate division Zixibacteria bacterium]|nr:hypothetical protein [candidate division Zixibacteria bacterium]
MVPRRAKMFVYGNDDVRCQEVQKFIEGAGILLEVRDTKEDPFHHQELMNLIGFLNISHFLNKMSESYTKHKLDEAKLSREEMIQLILDDHSLLRYPILQSTRLITVGCDQDKIANMLQIDANGQAEELPKDIGNRQTARRHSSRKRSAVSN